MESNIFLSLNLKKAVEEIKRATEKFFQNRLFEEKKYKIGTEMYHFENSVRLEVRIYLLALSHFFEEKKCPIWERCNVRTIRSIHQSMRTKKFEQYFLKLNIEYKLEDD